GILHLHTLLLCDFTLKIRFSAFEGTCSMKTSGLIGGMSWESSLLYYQIINETVNARLGGLHSAQCLMWAFDFAETEALQAAGDWEQAAQRMIDAAKRLQKACADGE